MNPFSYLPQQMDPLFATGLDNILSSAKVLLMMLVLLFIIMRTICYKNELAFYTAIPRKSTPKRFFLEIAIVLKQRGVFSSRQSLITILAPLPYEAPPETVTVMSMKGSNLYYVSAHSFCLAEPLTIRGLFSDGTFSFTGDVSVSIPWKDLHWERNSKPDHVSEGHCGFAAVRVLPDPRRF